MATTDINGLSTRLRTWLRDSTKVTFTDAEITEALTYAIDDDDIYIIDEDSSLTTLANTAGYAVPTGFQSITDLLVDYADDGFPSPLDQSAWEVVNGNIKIRRVYKGIPAGHKLYIRGKKKLDTNSTYPEYLQNFILTRGKIFALRYIQASLSTRFVKNDITMSEVSQQLAYEEREAERLRNNLPNKRAVIL